MEHSEDCLLALTIEAIRPDGGAARLHVQRMDRPVDYGYLSPAEFHYLLEALLTPAESSVATPTSTAPTSLRPPDPELFPQPRDLPERRS